MHSRAGEFRELVEQRAKVLRQWAGDFDSLLVRIVKRKLFGVEREPADEGTLRLARGGAVSALEVAEVNPCAPL
jgi:hypothetical protein